MTRRRLLALAAVLALLAVVALTRAQRPSPRVASARVAPARAIGPVAVPAEPAVHPVAPSPPASDPAAQAWTHRADDVGRACDLPVEPTCEGATCVALLHGPDLDHPLGWLGLLGSSPRFVVSTLLRDLGVDPEHLPCGAAIDALVAGAGVPMIELPDGTELWCATDGSGDIELCDRTAAERFGAAGFGAPGVRRLRFQLRQ